MIYGQTTTLSKSKTFIKGRFPWETAIRFPKMSSFFKVSWQISAQRVLFGDVYCVHVCSQVGPGISMVRCRFCFKLTCLISHFMAPRSRRCLDRGQAALHCPIVLHPAPSTSWWSLTSFLAGFGSGSLITVILFLWWLSTL